MKLLSSFLIAAYANTVVDDKECHAIDNHGNYRKFAAKSANHPKFAISNVLALLLMH